jgi:hypothetical protein
MVGVITLFLSLPPVSFFPFRDCLPYFLLTLLEKTPKNDIQVFITYFEDYQTKVKPLSDDQKGELLRMDTDVFFQLEELLSIQ